MSNGGGESIQEKYRALTLRYEDLVKKFQSRSAEKSGVWRLAQWTVLTSQSGLAILRGTRLLAANARWRTLDARAERRRPWVAGKRGDRREYATLRDAVAGETKRAGDTGLQALQLRRGRMRLEIRLERLAGELGDVAAIAYDVTAAAARDRELVKARRELVKRERMRAVGELASGIAHDLNNTFSAILLRLKALSKGVDEETRARLEPLSKLVLEAAATVGRVQDFARRRHDVPPGSVELSRIVHETVALAAAQLRESHVDVVVHLPQLLAVRGDAGEVRQLLLNLLLNARDAMPGGGTVTIDAGHAPGWTTARISDEGTGIPAKILERIFDPFFTTKGNRGTGLGLSNAYATMRRLGGSIEARNRSTGGAMFTLRFPDASEQGGQTPDSPAATPHAHAQALARRILVIDDDETNRDVLAELLAEDGHEVETAATGRAAVELVRAGFRYDLVLCDLRMPGSDGWTIADQLTGLAPALPVWITTGDGDAPQRARDHASVQGVLPKPLDVERVRQILGSLAH